MIRFWCSKGSIYVLAVSAPSSRDMVSPPPGYSSVLLARYRPRDHESRYFLYSELPIRAIDNNLCGVSWRRGERTRQRSCACRTGLLCASCGVLASSFSATGSFHSKPSYAACCVEEQSPQEFICGRGTDWNQS